MKKVLNIAKTVFVWLVIVAAVGMMIFTVVSVSTFNRYDRNIFGFKMFIVQTDSMKATDFAAGDLIFSKVTDTTTLKEGDIITFQSQDEESFGEIITHKIRRVTVDEGGQLGFVTYGTTTNTDDKTIVNHSLVLGKYVGKIPYAGTFFNFLKTTPGYIICILIPFLILILMQGVNCVKIFRKYRAEQMAELEAEKAQIAEERAKSEQMMQELLALKAQLAQQAAPVTAAPAAEAPVAPTEAPATPAEASVAPAEAPATPTAEVAVSATEGEQGENTENN